MTTLELMLFVRREVHRGSVANKEQTEEEEREPRLIRTPKRHAKCPYYLGVRTRAALRTDKGHTCVHMKTTE